MRVSVGPGLWRARVLCLISFFFFNDTATTEIYTLSLHDALPISEWIELRGVRVSGAGGRPERLVGVLRVTTEKVREAQRLHYRATRDELTGHLNRTSLREELSHAIEAAKAEQRTCAYLVASIDRLAAINEAYGFGAADEVIVAVGE